MLDRVEVMEVAGRKYVAFTCPGCKMHHMLPVDGTLHPMWGWNGRTDLPTLTPSIFAQATARITDEQHARIMAGEVIEPRKVVCHSFVTDGRIQFLGDCTHSLAGQTVDLPPVED